MSEKFLSAFENMVESFHENVKVRSELTKDFKSKLREKIEQKKELKEENNPWAPVDLQSFERVKQPKKSLVEAAKNGLTENITPKFLDLKQQRNLYDTAVTDVSTYSDAIGQEEQLVRNIEMNDVLNMHENTEKRLALLEQNFSIVDRRSRDYTGAVAGSGETKLIRLDDVESTPANAEFLRWDTDSGKALWVSAASSNLADSPDVNTSAQADGTFLQYNSAQSKYIHVSVASGRHALAEIVDLDGANTVTDVADEPKIVFDRDPFNLVRDASNDRILVKASNPFTINKANVINTGAESIRTAGGILLSGVIAGATTITCNNTITAQGVGSPATFLMEGMDATSNGDVNGTFTFKGKDSGGNSTQYFRIKSEVVNNIDGSEEGRLVFSATDAGNSAEGIEFDNDGINLLGSRTIRFAGADKFRILTTQPSTSVATSTSDSDGRIKIEIDGTEYFLPIYNA
tara:strand:- start:1448 stop:2827 length:1380 start_codon:yes stop_codon:yes gene_type:complete